MKKVPSLIAAALGAALFAGACATDNEPTVRRVDSYTSPVTTVDPFVAEMRQAFAEGAGLPPSHPLVVCAVDWLLNTFTFAEIATMTAADQEAVAALVLGECGHIA